MDTKITSLAGLCEELWVNRERLFEVAVKLDVISRSDGGWFKNNITSPIDAVWLFARSAGVSRIPEFGRFNYTINEYRHAPQYYSEHLEQIHQGFWRLREVWRELAYGLEPGGKQIDDEILGFFCRHNLLHYHIRVSKMDQTKWVYTQNAEHGAQDRQTRMRPGKLLKKLIPDLAETVVQNIATRFTQGTAGYIAQFARTKDEIVHVYTTGPSSCMSYSVEEFEHNDGPGCEGHHPAECYAGPDSAVAYITDIEGHVTARTVVNVNKKLYGRMYGNTVGLDAALKAAGYTGTDNWAEVMNGMRLLRIELDNGNLLCPYIDGLGRGRDDGEYLVLGSGPLCVQFSDGVIRVNGDDDDEYDSTCECCGNGFHSSDEGVYIESYGDVCDNCLSEDRFCMAVVSDTKYLPEEWRHRDSCTYIECIDRWVDDYVLEQSDTLDFLGITYCSSEGEWILTDEAVWIESENEWFRRDSSEVIATRNGDYELKCNCIQLHDSSWVKDDEDVVELGEFSSSEGEYALRDEVRPALGCDPDDVTSWVLKSEVTEYLGFEFYKRDCVKIPTPDDELHQLKWVPLLAAWCVDRVYIEAPPDAPWDDWHRKSKASSKPEPEQEEVSA